MTSQSEAETLLFKVLIVGASNVGKSSLFVRYTKNEFIENMMSTIGYDMKIKQVQVLGKNVKLQLFDAAGDPKFENILSSYYRGTHGIMIVYDITNEKSFEAVNKIIMDVENYAPSNAIVYLVGNKSDLEPKRQVSKEKAYVLANEHDFAYFETSAKTSANVDSTFVNLAERLVKLARPYDLGQSIKLTSEKEKKDLRDKVCCSYY